jgi:hypothetical protein
MMTRRWQTAFGVALGIAVLGSVTATAVQKEFSAASRQIGRAAVEYRDKHLQVVAAYYYSQRNHDSRWLMLETAFSTNEPATINRSDIVLRTPEGREIPLATQRQVGEDVNRIKALLQNATTVTHDVVSYFTQRDRVETINLFRLPFDDVVHDSFVVDRHRVAVGRLFFAAPTGAWEDGTYALVVRHANGTAEMPIRLE